MIELLADIAAEEIGSHETGGNNNGPKVRLYQSATELKPDSWPWCAAFVDWCVMKWLFLPGVTKWLDLQKSTPSTWRPRTAAAFGLLEWSRGHPLTTTLLPEDAVVQKGDIVVFDFSHCGIVESGNGHTITTIEGNTNGKGERDSASGDGVWRKERNFKLVQKYIRIHTRIV